MQNFLDFTVPMPTYPKAQQMQVPASTPASKGDAKKGPKEVVPMLSPIKAPKVEAIVPTAPRRENTPPPRLAPLYPSAKWGMRNPQLRQMWKQQDVEKKNDVS